MRIVTFDFRGQAPAVELSRALAGRGHDVLHLYSADVQTPKWDLTKHPDDAPGLTIEPLAFGSPPADERLLARYLFWGRCGRHVAKVALGFRPDVVLATSSTLFLHRVFRLAFKGSACQFVYWMQRFYFRRYDRTLRARGRLVEGALTYWVRQVETKLLESSDVIVVPAEYLMAMLEETGEIGSRQCMVVRPWAPLERVGPGEKGNSWGKEHGVTARCVVMQTGALDQEQCALLLACAQRLRSRADILLVSISDAASASFLSKEAARLGLTNLKALPFQDYDVYGQVLASADVLLCLVPPHDGVLSVPSELPFYLAAGRAIVAAAPSENVAADIVRESQAGLVVRPGEVENICAALTILADDEPQRTAAAQRARDYAEANFQIGKIADRFERLFERIHTGPPRRT